MTTDEKSFERAIRELVARVPTVLVEIDTVTLLQLVGCVQLALGHLPVVESLRVGGQRAIGKIIDVIHRQSPTLADMLRSGSNTVDDVIG